MNWVSGDRKQFNCSSLFVIKCHTRQLVLSIHTHSKCCVMFLAQRLYLHAVFFLADNVKAHCFLQKRNIWSLLTLRSIPYNSRRYTNASKPSGTDGRLAAQNLIHACLRFSIQATGTMPNSDTFPAVFSFETTYEALWIFFSIMHRMHNGLPARRQKAFVGFVTIITQSSMILARYLMLARLLLNPRCPILETHVPDTRSIGKLTFRRYCIEICPWSSPIKFWFLFFNCRDPEYKSGSTNKSTCELRATSLWVIMWCWQWMQAYCSSY